jgi:hypothetical protein
MMRRQRLQRRLQLHCRQQLRTRLTISQPATTLKWQACVIHCLGQRQGLLHMFCDGLSSAECKPRSSSQCTHTSKGCTCSNDAAASRRPRAWHATKHQPYSHTLQVVSTLNTPDQAPAVVTCGAHSARVGPAAGSRRRRGSSTAWGQRRAHLVVPPGGRQPQRESLNDNDYSSIDSRRF